MPNLIKDKACYITVETEDYEDQEGNTKKRNIVPFAGYERADIADAEASVAGENSMEDDSEDDLPF